MEYELPSNYGRVEDEDPQSPYRFALIGAGISVVIMAVGLYIFASNTENREDYHGWYLLAFFAFTIGFGVAFATKKFGIAVFCTVLLVGALGISMVKFDHRAKMTVFANTPGAASLLGDYAERLPPWEYDVLSLGSEPKWSRFDAECYRPILANKLDTLPESCKSKEAIQATYNINLLATINQRYALMRTTAQQIEQKQLTDKAAYDSCIASGGCTPVPLLPPDAKLDQITNASPEYRQIRNAFWQLIDNEEMDASLCEYISLCQAMFQAGAITRTDFESSKTTGTAATAAPAPTPVPSMSAGK